VVSSFDCCCWKWFWFNFYRVQLLVNCIGVRKRFLQMGANLLEYICCILDAASHLTYLPTYLLSLLLHRFYKLSILLGPQLLACRCIISAVAPHLPSSQAYVLKTTLWKHPARCWRTGVCLHACMHVFMCFPIFLMAAVSAINFFPYP
jgi:hypothetical protein